MDPSKVPPPCIDYFIRFVQVHETFRRPEIEALAILADVDVEFLLYSQSVSLIAHFLCRHYLYSKSNREKEEQSKMFIHAEAPMKAPSLSL